MDRQSTEFPDRHFTEFMDRQSTEFPDRHFTEFMDRQSTEFPDRHFTEFMDILNRTDLGKCTHLYNGTPGTMKHKRFRQKVFFVRGKKINS